VQGMSDTRTVKKYLTGNPWPKDHKEDPIIDGRITSNRTFAKWRSKIGQLASRIERNGRRRSLRRSKLSAIKDSSAPGRRRKSDRQTNLIWHKQRDPHFISAGIFFPSIL
jgi:hypothetical protein